MGGNLSSLWNSDRVPRYIVEDVSTYDPKLHRPATLGRMGRCSLHACSEPVVASVSARTESGRRVSLAMCRRGVDEYRLQGRRQ